MYIGSTIRDGLFIGPKDSNIGSFLWLNIIKEIKDMNLLLGYRVIKSSLV